MSSAMADRLLWKSLAGSIADGVTASNSDTEFDHDLDEGAWIREISMDLALGGAGPDESLTVEIGETPTLISGTNNIDFFYRLLRMEMPATGATPNDGGIARSRTWKFARGQVKVDASKKLYTNVSKTTGGAGNYRIQIGYEAV